MIHREKTAGSQTGEERAVSQVLTGTYHSLKGKPLAVLNNSAPNTSLVDYQ